MFHEAIHKPENSPTRTSAACEKSYDLGVFPVLLKMYFSFVESLKTCSSRACFTNNIAPDNCNLCCFYFFFSFSHYGPELQSCFIHILGRYYVFSFLFNSCFDAHFGHASDMSRYFFTVSYTHLTLPTIYSV